MHSSRMRTARLLTVSCSARRGLPNPSSPRCIPCVHVTCDVCSEAKHHPCEQTDTCKNITFPQTSFVDGNKYQATRRSEVELDWLLSLVSSKSTILSLEVEKCLLRLFVRLLQKRQKINR